LLLNIIYLLRYIKNQTVEKEYKIAK